MPCRTCTGAWLPIILYMQPSAKTWGHAAADLQRQKGPHPVAACQKSGQESQSCAAAVQVISFNLGSLWFLTNHSWQEGRHDILSVIHGSENLEQCAIDGSVSYHFMRAASSSVSCLAQ